MDTGRQWASNDKVLNGYLICKPYLERENAKRAGQPKTNELFLLVPGEYSSLRNTPIERDQKGERERSRERERERERERGKENTLALNLHVYSPDTPAYRRGGLTRSRSDETGPREERAEEARGASRITSARPAISTRR